MSQRCPKCGQKYGRKKRQKTKHHVYPKWLFGIIGNDYTEELCRGCHDELHEIIRGMEKEILRKCKYAYNDAFIKFMAT